MTWSFVKKYPAIVTVIPFAVGILISYYSDLKLSVIPEIFFIVILASLITCSIYLFKTINKGELFLFSYISILVFYGIFSFQFRYFKTGEDNIAVLTNDLKNKNIILRGIIAEQPEIKEDRIRILIESESADSKECSGLVLATIYKNKYGDRISNSFEYGDEIEIEGRVEPLPHQRNPGEFNYGEYLKMHDIDAVFYSYGYNRISSNGNIEKGFFRSRIIYPIKNYSIEIIDKLVGGDEGEYLKGLLLGERSNISKETKENFVNAGVAHIIAVSGLNVAYVMLIILGILTFIPIKQKYKIIITIISLLFYMNLTGNSPSIVRATVMAIIYLLAQVIERKPNNYNIISFSALVILLFDPRQLFDSGFILSYCAIFSLVIIYPVIEKLLDNSSWYVNLSRNKYTGKISKGIILLFAGTFSAQIGTLPITAIMFKKVSTVSLIANLFEIPLSNISLAIGFIMIILSPISMWLASVLASLNLFLLHIQLLMVEFCAKLDISYVETYFVDRMLFVFYYLMLIMILSLKKENYKIRIAIITLLFANFIVWRSVLDKTGKAQITYIDVGNSNSTLIKMPEGTSVLINTGSSTEKYNSAERNTIPYLKLRGINDLDLLIVTTLNYNEFRNLKYFAENFHVKKTLIPFYYKPIFENMLISSSFEKTNIEFVDCSLVVNKQGKFRIYLFYDSIYRGESMMAQFVYGDQSFLFDDAYNTEEDIINTSLFNDNNTRILKTAGSGSFDYVSSGFLLRSNPEFVIISSAGSNRKRLNTDIFTESLKHIGIKVLKTNEEGALIFETNGISTERVAW